MSHRSQPARPRPRRQRVTAVLSVVASVLACLATMVAAPGTAWAASSWLQVSTAYATTCGIKADNSLWCWGQNDISQLGLGNSDHFTRLQPTQVGTDYDWASVSLGGQMACALKTDQTRWCWGFGFFGMPGPDYLNTDRGDWADHPVHGPDDGTWVSISVGLNHMCGIRTDAHLYCWGANSEGQLGIGSFDTPVSLLPTSVAPHSLIWTAVSAGSLFTCGITTNGTRWCWGKNDYGQLGLGDYARRKYPIRLLDGWTWASVSAGGDHACGVRTDGGLFCWGANDAGQLGVGDNTDRNRPTRSGSGWASVSAYGGVGEDAHTCGVKLDQARGCWGANNFGQLGTGDTTDLNRAAGLYVDGPWQSIAAGRAYTCAVNGNTGLYCWGSNYMGRLGLDSYENHSTPTLVE